MSMSTVPSDLSIPINNEADVVTARQKGREMAASLGFSSTEQTLVALAISEIVRNIVSYAQRGDVRLAVLDESGRKGILVVAVDQGPGIEDIALAMRDGYSTARSLGMGLPGAKRVMDDFVLESEPGRGTTVTMKKWLTR